MLLLCTERGVYARDGTRGVLRVVLLVYVGLWTALQPCGEKATVVVDMAPEAHGEVGGASTHGNGFVCRCGDGDGKDGGLAEPLYLLVCVGHQPAVRMVCERDYSTLSHILAFLPAFPTAACHRGAVPYGGCGDGCDDGDEVCRMVCPRTALLRYGTAPGKTRRGEQEL